MTTNEPLANPTSSTPKPELLTTFTDFRAYISRQGSTAVVKAHRNDPDSPWHAAVWVNDGHTYCYGRKFKTDKGLMTFAEREL
jgi:hypothetical protein